jgi:hypothetical protein
VHEALDNDRSGDGTATGPGDRDDGGSAVRQVYDAVGLEPPRTIVWAPEPTTGAMLATILADPDMCSWAADPAQLDLTCEQAWDPLGLCFWYEAEDRLVSALQDQLPERTWPEALWNGPGRQLSRHTAPVGAWSGVPATPGGPHPGSDPSVPAPLGHDVFQAIGAHTPWYGEQGFAWAQTEHAHLGQGAVAHLAHRRDLRRRTGLSAHLLDGLARLARNVSWWWAFENVAVLVDRPSILHIDALGLLHRPDGPAAAWQDGLAVHAWHGVPGTVLDRSEWLTPSTIRTTCDAQARRVLLDHYDPIWYARDVGALVDQGDDGRLWRAEIVDSDSEAEEDEPVVVVELAGGGTAAPDRRWRRVPPGTRTARDAADWAARHPEDHRPPELDD